MTTRTPTVLRPPSVDGVAEATARDHLASLWWQVRDYRYESTHGGPRITLALLMFGWVFAVAPLLVPIVLARLRSTRSRYFSTGQAIIGVVAQRRSPEPTWLLGDHAVAAQRQGYGKVLRDALFPSLLATCDHDRIVLVTETRSERLARQYAAELPGATITRRRNGTYLIRRTPQPPTGEGAA